MQSNQDEPGWLWGKRVAFCLLLFTTVIVIAHRLMPGRTLDSSVALAQGQTFTISGRVTEPPPGTGPGITGVTLTLLLNNTTQSTTQTNANGDFSFGSFAAGSDFEVTPTKAGFVFQPTSQGGTGLNQNRTLNFTGSAAPPTPTPTPTPSPLQLIVEQSGPTANQAAALDSVLLIRDPLQVINQANLFTPALDRNSRVVIFVTNLELAPGEQPSAVVINLIDSLNQGHDIPAEDVRPVPNLFTQVVFRLPDNLPAGATTCTITVKAHNLVSNAGTLRIRN